MLPKNDTFCHIKETVSEHLYFSLAYCPICVSFKADIKIYLLSTTAKFTTVQLQIKKTYMYSIFRAK